MNMKWVTITLSDTAFLKTIRDNFRIISELDTLVGPDFAACVAMTTRENSQNVLWISFDCAVFKYFNFRNVWGQDVWMTEQKTDWSVSRVGLSSSATEETMLKWLELITTWLTPQSFWKLGCSLICRDSHWEQKNNRSDVC